MGVVKAKALGNKYNCQNGEGNRKRRERPRRCSKCTGRTLRGHIFIIMKSSPHYVRIEFTISGP